MKRDILLGLLNNRCCCKWLCVAYTQQVKAGFDCWLGGHLDLYFFFVYTEITKFFVYRDCGRCTLLTRDITANIAASGITVVSISACERLVAILCPCGEQRHDKFVEGLESHQQSQECSIRSHGKVSMSESKSSETPGAHKPYSPGGHFGSILVLN